MRILVDAKDGAKALGISRTHFYNLYNSGRLGPQPIALGRSKRWVLVELVKWGEAHCPAQDIWAMTEQPEIMAG